MASALLTTPTAVASELHVPTIISTDGDLNLASGGDLFVSMPGSPHALRVHTSGSDLLGAEPPTTTVTSGANRLALRTPETSLHSKGELKFEATESLTYRAGSEPLAGGITSVAHETVAIGLLGTGENDMDGSYLKTISDTTGSDTILSARGTASGGETYQSSSVEMTKSGSAYYRAGAHTFAVANDDVLSITAGHITILKDLEISGSLNSIDGSVGELRVEDHQIRVATDTEAESEVAQGPSGLYIESVPDTSGDVEMLGAFRTSDGTRMFISQNSDGIDQVDVDTASSARIFHKGFVHRVNQGERASGGGNTASRANEPYWDVCGGAMHMTRYVPSVSQLGDVYRFAVVLRVTDGGEFEVARTKTIFRHIPGTSTFAKLPDEFTVMQRCEVTNPV